MQTRQIRWNGFAYRIGENSECTFTVHSILCRRHLQAQIKIEKSRKSPEGSRSHVSHAPMSPHTKSADIIIFALRFQ